MFFSFPWSLLSLVGAEIMMKVGWNGSSTLEEKPANLSKTKVIANGAMTFYSHITCGLDMWRDSLATDMLHSHTNMPIFNGGSNDKP